MDCPGQGGAQDTLGPGIHERIRASLQGRTGRNYIINQADPFGCKWMIFGRRKSAFYILFAL